MLYAIINNYKYDVYGIVRETSKRFYLGQSISGGWNQDHIDKRKVLAVVDNAKKAIELSEELGRLRIAQHKEDVAFSVRHRKQKEALLDQYKMVVPDGP